MNIIAENKNKLELHDIIYVSLHGLSFLMIILGVIYASLKKRLFIIYKLLLMIQISEGLNCISKFLVFLKKFKNKEIDNNDLNKGLCLTQIFLDNFADFCTLSVNAYISFVLYHSIKTGNNSITISSKCNLQITIISLLLSSVIFSTILFLINYFAYINENKLTQFYKKKFCSTEPKLIIVAYIAYWTLLFVNIIFLILSIKYLKYTATSLSDVYDDDINEYNKSQNICEISDTGISSDVLNNVRKFIKKFIIFIVTLFIMWVLLFIYNLLIIMNVNPTNNCLKVFTYIYKIICGIMGGFYSFCYFFILTDFGSHIIKKCCFCFRRYNSPYFNELYNEIN